MKENYFVTDCNSSLQLEFQSKKLISVGQALKLRNLIHTADLVRYLIDTFTY